MAGPLPYDHLFKILLIGDAAVGKSSIMLRFTDDSFDDKLQSTIGVDFKVKMMEVGDKKIKMTIWDTAGQERFRTLTSSYYRGAQGIMLVYDVERPETFDNLNKWLEEVETYHPGRGRDVVKLLVGNKVDCPRAVPREQAEAWARSKGMLFLEASAKTEVGIRQAFEEVVHKILESPALLANTTPGKPRTVDLAATQNTPPSGAGGCGC
ncbi:Rab18, rab family GTPase [Tribonema minus]|uniref:Rab18, rab family GTPase n=1 Tax=Tribonema minus TaxID=303371 RepID=A0A835YPZ0_9STRA|nr:Rab18, rab family GTPase [Tribonema minus]